MNELHRAQAAADKLDEEYEILSLMREQLAGDRPTPAHAALLLQQAKRCRRECNHLVRALAQLRDQLQSLGGSQAND